MDARQFDRDLDPFILSVRPIMRWMLACSLILNAALALLSLFSIWVMHEESNISLYDSSLVTIAFSFVYLYYTAPKVMITPDKTHWLQ